MKEICYSEETNRPETELETRATLMRPKERKRSRACAYLTQPHWNYNIRPCKKRPVGMQILSKDNDFSRIHTTAIQVWWILHGNRLSRTPIFNVRERPTRQILILENTRLSSLTCTNYERSVLRPNESINENNLIEFLGYFATLKFVVKKFVAICLKFVIKMLLFFK